MKATTKRNRRWRRHENLRDTKACERWTKNWITYSCQNNFLGKFLMAYKNHLFIFALNSQSGESRLDFCCWHRHLGNLSREKLLIVKFPRWRRVQGANSCHWGYLYLSNSTFFLLSPISIISIFAFICDCQFLNILYIGLFTFSHLKSIIYYDLRISNYILHLLVIIQK